MNKRRDSKKVFTDKNLPVPKLEGWTYSNKTYWILIQYIAGMDLRRFNKDMANRCADSLSGIFNMYWQDGDFEENKRDNRFERYWTRINKRAECLKNEITIASAYVIFLDRQLVCPRTLCNGDFLQCNAIESELNDESIERDEGFTYYYYYYNAEILVNIILKGKEQLIIS